jgi:hypothetical protein
MHKHPQHPDTARAVLAFFDWVYHSGATTVGALEYILLPESVVKLVEQRWQQITDRAGNRFGRDPPYDEDRRNAVRLRDFRKRAASP